jgi:hypothetical protein
MGMGRSVRRVTLWGLVPAVVTLAGAFFDRVAVVNREDLGGVTFGTPFGWLMQDQNSMSPPFPHEQTFVSPWEHPTGVAFGPLIADFLIVCVVLLMVGFVGRLVLRALNAKRVH